MGVGRPEKKSNCFKEQGNLRLYLNEGAKYLGVALQAFPEWAFADASFLLGGFLSLFGPCQNCNGDTGSGDFSWLPC